ncbi:alpha/beta hydrolase [Desulforhopalus singaporensis]|uniref:Esterase/lipase n=1 Tax=Desulforhopalus singaporensis TaxID=91360 RepID=A0A1H0T3H6_9BACT|nr:alpha/beta fold hydrolase [Desulforhopalus singaporensis]SDP48593.1 Esterase/lipase [Desulforhopalus singaporensis]
MNVLFFHGFSANPADLEKSVTLLTRNGHTVFTPAMTTLGADGKNYGPPGAWLKEAGTLFQTYANTTEHPFCIAGHSLGGVLCARILTSPTLQKTYIDKVAGCAFLATPAGIDEKFLHFRNAQSIGQTPWPFALQVKMFSFLRESDTFYRKVPVPSVVLQGGSDRHIPPDSGKTLAGLLGSNCTALYHREKADHFFPNGSSTAARFLQKKLANFITTMSIYDNDA